MLLVDVVVLEALPEDAEVVDLLELADVESLHPLVKRHFFR